MEKICSRCKISQNRNNFHKSKRDGYVSNCKKCRKEILQEFHKKHPGIQREYNLKWRKENKDRIKLHLELNREKTRRQARERWKNDPRVKIWARNNLMKKHYGITLEDFNLLVEKQDGICLICKQPPNNNKKSDYLYVDHDHKTGKVRGLLCHKCNTGLGCYDDNVLLLEEAIRYLNLHRGKSIKM